MLGTGMIPRQTGQGKRGSLTNGPNPDTKPGSGLLGSELRTGAEIPLELAGQNPEAAAQQAGQILENELKSFNGQELTNLGVITIEAIGRIGLGPNAVAPIDKEFKLTTMPFAEKANELFVKASDEIQQVLSDNSGSTQDPNKSPLGFFGPNTPSKQNPQGPVSAA